jgi:hypothetical protein
MASFFDAGSGLSLKTGLWVLTNSRKRSGSMCFSRNARLGGVLLMSICSTAILCSSRKLLAFLHVVQVGLA